MTDLMSLFDPVRSGAAIPPEPMDGLRRRVRRRRNRRRGLAAGLASAVLVGGFGAWQTTDGDGDATTEIRTADQPGEAQAAEPTFVLEERVRPPGDERFRLRLGWILRTEEGPCVVLEILGDVSRQRTDVCTSEPVDDVYADRFTTVAGGAVLGWVEPGIEGWGTDAVAFIQSPDDPVQGFGGRKPFVFFNEDAANVRIEAPFESYRDPDLVLPPPETDRGGIEDLELTLDVTATTVPAGRRFRAALVVANPSGRAIPDPACEVAGGYGIRLVTSDEPEVSVAGTGVTAECAGTASFPARSRTSKPLRSFALVDQDEEPLSPGAYLAVIDLGDTAPDVDPVPVRVTEAEE